MQIRRAYREDVRLRGEEEIVERGFYLLRLRMVKANKRALAFYLRWGWKTVREFPHETFSFIPMLELRKCIQSR